MVSTNFSYITGSERSAVTTNISLGPSPKYNDTDADLATDKGNILPSAWSDAEAPKYIINPDGVGETLSDALP